MNKNRVVLCSILLAAVLLSTLMLSGCGTVPGDGRASAGSSAAASGNKPAAPGTSGNAAPDNAASTAAPLKDDFAAAFKTVDKNPLNENIQYALWLAAHATPAPTDASAGTNALAIVGLIDKYNALVAGTGVHYTQVTEAMGMKMNSEVWMKAGKFKVIDELMEEVKIFDGQSYVKYDIKEKTGTRYTKEMMSGDIDMQLNGAVRTNSASAFRQKEDKKFGKFNCCVFFMEMNAMGIKSVTVYMDKETGMVVNYATDGDKLMISSTTVTKFEAGGFGDEVFTVPADVTVVDYQP